MADVRQLDDSRVRVTTLPNGVRVVTEHVPHVHGIAFGLRVDGGARLEPEDRSGISHLIEHVVHKGSERYTSREMAEAFDAIGGSMEAYTTQEYTGYGFRVLPEHFGQALDILADMLLRPRLDEADLELEKSVVLEEYRGMLDAPEDFTHETFCRNLWPDHPLGRSVLGSPEVIEGLTAADIRTYMAGHYVPGAFICAAAGDLEHDRLVERINEHFCGMLEREFEPHRSRPGATARRERIERDTEQVYFCLGKDAPSEEDPDRWVLRVVNFILGQGLSSRLFQEVREKRGLAYSIGSDFSTYRGAGLFTIQADTGLDEFDQVLELLEIELRQLCADGLTEAELERSRQAVRAGILLAQDHLGARMVRLARGLLYQGQITPLTEIAALVERISLEDCRRVAAEWLQADAQSLTAVGPFGKPKRRRRRAAAAD